MGFMCKLIRNQFSRLVKSTLTIGIFCYIASTGFASRDQEPQNLQLPATNNTEVISVHRDPEGNPMVGQQQNTPLAENEEGHEENQDLSHTNPDIIEVAIRMVCLTSGSTLEDLPMEIISPNIEKSLKISNMHHHMEDTKLEVSQNFKLAFLAVTNVVENFRNIYEKLKSDNLDVERFNGGDYLNHILSMEKEEALERIHRAIQRLVAYKRKWVYEYCKFIIEEGFLFDCDFSTNYAFLPCSGFLSDGDDIPGSNQEQDAKKMANLMVEIYDRKRLHLISSTSSQPGAGQNTELEKELHVMLPQLLAAVAKTPSAGCDPYRLSFIESLVAECCERDARNEQGIHDRFASLMNLQYIDDGFVLNCALLLAQHWGKWRYKMCRAVIQPARAVASAYMAPTTSPLNTCLLDLPLLLVALFRSITLTIEGDNYQYIDDFVHWTDNCVSLYMLLLAIKDTNTLGLSKRIIDRIIGLSNKIPTEYADQVRSIASDKSVEEYFILRQTLIEELLKAQIFYIQKNAANALNRQGESMPDVKAYGPIPNPEKERRSLVKRISEQIENLEHSTHNYIKTYIKTYDMEEGDISSEMINATRTKLLRKLRDVLVKLGGPGYLEEVGILDDVLLNPGEVATAPLKRLLGLGASENTRNKKARI